MPVRVKIWLTCEYSGRRLCSQSIAQSQGCESLHVMDGTMQALIVQLEGAAKSYGGTVALARVELTVRAGEFFTLLGPSGSGKTTTLRLIAGFERPDAGRIFLDDQDVAALPPFERSDDGGVMVPLWSSYLARVYAWRVILSHNSLLNWTLMEIGLPMAHIGYSNWAMWIVFSYLWLLFMILPVAASVERIPPSLLEVSADLGASSASEGCEAPDPVGGVPPPTRDRVTPTSVGQTRSRPGCQVRPKHQIWCRLS